MPVFYCAIIPTTVPHAGRARGDGIVATSVAESVYTLAHAVGFVTCSFIRGAFAFTKVGLEEEVPMAFRMKRLD